ncbi:hypothetical protein J6590_032856 [Homalodisca vitripennis]|nr:hypothetical protein J6590_032856 [Homalodisca vitripennis]
MGSHDPSGDEVIGRCHKPQQSMPAASTTHRSQSGCDKTAQTVINISARSLSAASFKGANVVQSPAIRRNTVELGAALRCAPNLSASLLSTPLITPIVKPPSDVAGILKRGVFIRRIARRAGVTPEKSGTMVRHIRKTVTGGVLLELAKCDDRRKLHEAIQKAVGDRGDVRSIVPKARLEILDLDALTTEADISDYYL